MVAPVSFRRPVRPRWWAALAVLLAALAACGGGSDTGGADTTAPPASTTTSAGLGEGLQPERGGRRALTGFDEVAATITAADGSTCDVCLLSATTEAQRQRGLMEVTDPELGGYDGMLFRFPDDIRGGFWMRNTPMPLSIAYFDGSGAFVSSTDMAPCTDSADCPSYPAGGPFRLALEVPEGGLADLGVADGATIAVADGPCPAAERSS